MRWLMAVAAVCAVVCSGAAGAASCELRFGWDPYPPYTFATDAGEVTGADVELMRELATAVGCEITFVKLPWARLLLELKNGTVDVTSSASWTTERAEYAYFSVPYRRTTMAIFVRHGTASRYRLRDLSDIPETGFRLGVIFGYFYGQEFAHLMQDPNFAAHVDPAADYPTNIRKLLHARIDGFLVDDVAVMRAEAEAVGATDLLEQYPLRLPGDEFHLIFSRRSVAADLVSAIDRQLHTMRVSGRIQAILEQFVP